MSSVERPSIHSHDQADPADGLFSASSTVKRHRRWPWLVALIVVAVVAFLVFFRSSLGQSNSARMTAS